MWPWQKGASICAGLGASVVLLVVVAASTPAQRAGTGTTRDFAIAGGQYAFRPAAITVDRNDLVKITFTAEDIAHSFTIDAYRISKRAGAGQTVDLRVPRRSARHLRLLLQPLHRLEVQADATGRLHRQVER